MNKKIFSKILAIMLIINLTFANFLYLAVYAANVNYETQETSINKTDVSFDAYFISEDGQKTHTKVTEMNNNELKLFLSVSVTKGYLKDAKVTIGNANFKLVEGQALPNGVQSIDTRNNTVTLNQINKGEAREIELQIEIVKDQKFDLNNFSKDAEVKLTGTFVNNSAKEIKAEKSIIVNLALSGEVESNLTGRISKYAVFEEEGKQKALIQLAVSSKVIDNLLPVKSTEIGLTVPTLFGLNPEKVSVTASSTKATNGDDGRAFSENNYKYANGILSLKVVNEPDKNNKVEWEKDTTDEYIINLIYSLENDATTVPEQKSEDNRIELTIVSRLSLYNNEEKQIDKEISGELILPEPSNNVVSYEISNKEKEIAKGYMQVANAANTEYKQEIKVNIGYNPTINNIEINKNKEYYTDEEGRNHLATTYYKQIAVSREKLVKILGENGKIDIISNGVTLATLNKDTTSYIFEQEISDLSMITSEPIAEGILTIETDKYIKSLEYNEEIIKSINKLTTSIIGKARLIEEEAITEIPLVQPTLQISSSINNSNLSTVIENENVEMRVSLQTNNNTNILFKNPIIEIELPSYIQEIKFKKINVLYNSELQAKAGDVIINDNGNKVIRIILEGEQTKFNDILSVEGTTLIIVADITVDKTAPSITEKMNVRVTNNNGEIAEASSNITYMAPTGIITLNSISGYNNEQEELTSMSGEQETGKIDVSAKSRVATEKITIINNNDYTCGDVAILGRTPTEGNKSLSTNKDLGSTFTAEMISTIKAVEGIEDEKVKVYYSENENATKDLNNSNNGWVENLENLENVKSYLIQVEDEMKKGDKIAFSYDVEIPGGLAREESTYSTYQVSTTNLDGALQGVSETTTAPVVGLSTGTGPELKVELSANVANGVEVKEGEIIEYKVKVTNTGKTDVNDITVEAPIPKGTVYTFVGEDYGSYIFKTDPTVEKYTDTIKSLAVGASIEKKFLLTVGSKTEDEWAVEVEAVALVNDDGKPVTFTSNKMSNEKEKAYFKLELEKGNFTTLEAGKNITYYLEIGKLGEDDINNLQIECEIPTGLTYVSSDYNEETVKQKLEGSKIIWSMEQFSSNENLSVTFKIDEFKEDRIIPVKMVGKCDKLNGTIESKTETITVGNPKLEISHTSNNSTGQMTEGDEIVYTITVKNTGVATAYNTKITDYASEGLTLKTAKCTLGDKTDTYNMSGNTHTIKRDIPGNSTLVIELTARADELEENETTKTLSNRFEVQADNTEKLSSSTIEHKISKKAYTIDDNDQVVETSSISGLAWLDENGDGIRDLNEKLLPEIPVILINEKGQTVASNITDQNGAYIFNNLTAGNYIVVFLYDMGNYDVTSYGAEDQTKNNDAVMMNINIEGTQTPCAATNVITLTSNVYNIDLGLKVNPKFDLSLTKTISKITVKTSKETTTNTYNNAKLQKVEIPSKYLQGATVTVEYEITVTNSGAIAGFASKIVDYLASTDLKFNSETNTDWYLGTDGNIYNSSLANKLLQPGESATLKLVLTKQVTESNTGLTNNTAEIYEAYNDAGLEDYNSTPANKAQNENDLGQADIIIGPKTGVFLYIGFAIIFSGIMAVGIYIVNKKVINKI